MAFNLLFDQLFHCEIKVHLYIWRMQGLYDTPFLYNGEFFLSLFFAYRCDKLLCRWHVLMDTIHQTREKIQPSPGLMYMRRNLIHLWHQVIENLICLPHLLVPCLDSKKNIYIWVDR